MLEQEVKYTAREILEAAGLKSSDVFGKDGELKMRCRIGGLPVHGPDHIVRVLGGSVDLVVGTEKHTVKTKKNSPKTPNVSEGAQVALEAEGVEVTKQAEELQKAKATARVAKENKE